MSRFRMTASDTFEPVSCCLSLSDLHETFTVEPLISVCLDRCDSALYTSRGFYFTLYVPVSFSLSLSPLLFLISLFLCFFSLFSLPPPPPSVFSLFSLSLSLLSLPCCLLSPPSLSLPVCLFPLLSLISLPLYLPFFSLSLSLPFSSLSLSLCLFSLCLFPLRLSSFSPPPPHPFFLSPQRVAQIKNMKYSKEMTLSVHLVVWLIQYVFMCSKQLGQASKQTDTLDNRVSD